MSETSQVSKAESPVLRAILDRRSYRSFTGRPVPEEAEATILEAGTYAFSSEGTQPWYFIVVREAATKERLNWVARDSECLYGMWTPVDRQGRTSVEPPDFTRIPLCIAIFADNRESPPFVEGEMSHIVAAAMATQNMWLAASALDLGASMWTHLEQDQTKSVLGVPHHEYFVGILGIGYPEGTAEEEPSRRPLEEVTGWEWFRVRRGQSVPTAKLDLLKEYLGI